MLKGQRWESVLWRKRSSEFWFLCTKWNFINIASSYLYYEHILEQRISFPHWISFLSLNKRRALNCHQLGFSINWVVLYLGGLLLYLAHFGHQRLASFLKRLVLGPVFLICPMLQVNIREIVCLNCGEGCEDMIHYRSYAHDLMRKMKA